MSGFAVEFAGCVWTGAVFRKKNIRVDGALMNSDVLLYKAHHMTQKPKLKKKLKPDEFVTLALKKDRSKS